MISRIKYKYKNNNNDKNIAQSSAKSEHQWSKLIAPRLRSDFSPMVTPSTRVRNSCFGTGQHIVSIAACIIKRNNTGPSHEPCRTPIELSNSDSTSPTFTLILACSWSLMTILTKWSGRPTSNRISLMQHQEDKYHANFCANRERFSG